VRGISVARTEKLHEQNSVAIWYLLAQGLGNVVPCLERRGVEPALAATIHCLPFDFVRCSNSIEQQINPWAAMRVE